MRNVAEGVASSFSCGDTCPCPPASSNAYLTPGTSVGPMGGTAQFGSMEQRQDCRGTVFGPYNRTSDSTWSSSDTSVFTVSSGLVSCLQPGSGTVTAQFQATVYGQFCAPISITQRPGGPVTVFRLRISASGSSIHFEDSDSGASIVAGEAFAMMVDAVDANGNLIALGSSVPMNTSASRTLASGEIGVPSSFLLGTSGHYDIPGVLLNRVNGTDSGTSYRFSTAGGAFRDFSLFTYFRVTSTREGLVGGPLWCGGTVKPNDHFVSLPVAELCGVSVVVRKPTSGQSEATTKKDKGPHFPGPGTACDPNGTMGGDFYWNTGTRPRVESLTCETGNNNLESTWLTALMQPSALHPRSFGVLAPSRGEVHVEMRCIWIL